LLERTVGYHPWVVVSLVPLLFCSVAPSLFRRRGVHALVGLWCVFLLMSILLGWYDWRVAFGHDSPSVPLANIVFYVVPIGLTTGCAAIAVCRVERRRPTRSHLLAALAAAYLALLPAAILGAVLAFVIYGMTGGFV
jgi:hypothetical protein